MTWRAALSAIPFCLIGAGAASTAPYEVEWLNDLSIQLLVQNDCAVRYFLNVTEAENVAGLLYSARANCSDNRCFDAYRNEGEWGFIVEQCGVEAC